MAKATFVLHTTFFLFNIVCGLLPGQASNYVSQLYHKKLNYNYFPMVIKAPNTLPLVHGHHDHSSEIHPKQVVSNESPTISNYHLIPVVYHVPVYQLLYPSTPNQSTLSQTQTNPSIVPSEHKPVQTHEDLEIKPTSYISKSTNTDLDGLPLKPNPILNNNVQNEESETSSLHFSKNTIIFTKSDDDESTQKTSIKSESILEISGPEITNKDDDQQTTKFSASTFSIDREGSKMTTSKKLINIIKNKNNLSYKLDLFSKAEEKEDATEYEY